MILMGETPERRIHALGVRRSYPKGAMVFFPGERAMGFYYLLRGEVRVYQMDDGGKEAEISRFGPGEFFGEAVALAEGVYPAFARATEVTDVLYFDSRKIWREIERDPAVARFFLRLLAGKCLLLSGRIEALGLRTVRQRLIQFLLAGCSGEGRYLIELKLRKADLARALGTIPETLSRTLKELKNEGLIEVTGRTIRILDCLKLRKELQG